MTIDEIRQLLEHPEGYRQQEWRGFLKAIFPTAELFAQPQQIEGAKDDLPPGFQIGRVMLADGRRIAFIEQPVTASINLIRNRVSLRNRVARLIDQESATGVLAVFTQDKSPNFRLSFVARESALVFTEEGTQTQRTETAQKRFTYYIGPDEACTTAAQRFDQLAKLGTSAELPHLIEAFSVEKLNDEFFRDFSSAVSRVENEIQTSYPKWSEILCRTEAQTLLNRLVFLYFVQRKGWLNRESRFLLKEFTPHREKKGHTFFTQFLAPLFECLSTEPSLAPEFPHDVPFLNGGLFSDEAGANEPDVGRRVKLNVSNKTFAYIFDDLLERYNFTIVEDSPSSVEVAIDPEMLGRVFEALVLQEEESDTGGKSRRHDTGSHYTPRPIVHYLCREALAGWLENQTPFNGQTNARQKIDTLLAIDATEGLDESSLKELDALFTPENAADLTQRLLALRMCDPAVGSGAFPLGFLHTMLNALRLCETRNRGQDPAEGDRNWLYETKKKVIEQVIYGVDIQAQAIELCKLRLWLSLMVDHELSADPFRCSQGAFQKALRQLEPLPNLDFKIRPANSLLDLIHGQRLRLDASSLPGDSRNHVRALADAKHRFYVANKSKEKRKARAAIYGHYAALVLLAIAQEKSRHTVRIKTLKDNGLRDFSALGEAAKEAELILKLLQSAKREKDTKQDEILRVVEERLYSPQRPSFLWPFDFAEVFFGACSPADEPATPRGSLSLANASKGQMELTLGTEINPHGFDLVLGNPPYIRIQTLKKTDPELADYFKKRFHSASKGNYDLYVCFVERGMELLHSRGQLAYILPHKFFNAQYGQPLRELLSDGKHLRHVVHFGDQQIFPGATNYVCLLFLAKQGSDKFRFVKADDLKVWQRIFKGAEGIFNADTIGEAEWNFAVGTGAGVFDRLKNFKRKLSTVAEIFVGLQTDGDEVYILELESESGDVAVCRSKFTGKAHKFERAHLKRLLKGSVNVRRWHLDQVTKRLIFPYQTVRGKSVLIDADEYESKWPLTWKYLEACQKRLQRGARESLGDNWYGYVYKKNHTKFDQIKLVVPSIASEACFAIDQVGDCFFVGSGGGGGGGYGITLKAGIGLHQLSLLAILNSKVSSYYLHKTSSTFRGGYIALNRQFIEQLPIPDLNPIQEKTIVRAVEWLLWLYEQENVRTGTGGNARDPLMAAYLEQWVSGMVYELFFPVELHAAGIKLFDLATAHLPPVLSKVADSARLSTIRQIFEKLHEVNHPVSVGLFSLGSVAEVRIIEGRE